MGACYHEEGRRLGVWGLGACSYGEEGRLGVGSGENKLFPVPLESGDASFPSSFSVDRDNLRPKFIGIIAGAYHNALQDLRSQNFLLF